MQNINSVSIEEKKTLQQEMFGMQQISTNAKKEWNAYIEKVESQFQEDTFSAADTRVTMENILMEWQVISETCVSILMERSRPIFVLFHWC